MVSDKKLANAVGGKTARACDSCIRKRARWYCAADDAFLCQPCNASVHSANPLARRHERVRLKTASSTKSSSDEEEEEEEEDNPLPSWHQGFTRKARTPRHGKQRHPSSKSRDFVRNPLQHLVPEIGADETTSHEENEEQLLYRVPIFDPFVAELCLSTNNSSEGKDRIQSKTTSRDHGGRDVNSVHGFLPSDMDLADFAADVESLLGKGLDEESFDMEGLGLLDCTEKDLLMEGSSGNGIVKVEEDDVAAEMEMAREPFELNFDYDSPLNCEEDDKAEVGTTIMEEREEYHEVGDVRKKKKVLLALNYEGVMAAWADQRSPWTTGDRPELDANDCWQDCMGGCGIIHYPYGDMGISNGHTAMLDEGREARVSRYREKRRTRLFSKKIRYEVRKLNAEKRPRMKGRFVKRANFAVPAAFPLLNK